MGIVYYDNRFLKISSIKKDNGTYIRASWFAT